MTREQDPFEKELRALLRKEIFGYPRGMHAGGGTMDHPLMHALREKRLSPDELKQFCDVRYNAASKFEILLERATQMAAADPQKTELAHALDENLGDERGTSARSQGRGGHAGWRSDFLNAMEVPQRGKKTYPLYQYNEKDELPVLAGILLAAEFSVPPEDGHLLRALRSRFPDTFTDPCHPEDATDAQKKATLYLADHIHHDSENHFPELMAAIIRDFPAPEDRAKVISGIQRFTAERKQLFDHIQGEIGLDTSKSTVQGK